MRKRTIIPTLAASLLGLAALATPSAAIHGGGHVGMGAPMVHAAPIGRSGPIHMYSSPHYAWHHDGIHHFRHRHGVFIAAGYPYYYDYDYGYYGGCGWLYRRAVATGSSYWWHRYRRCEYYRY